VACSAVISVNVNPSVRIRGTLLGRKTSNGDSVSIHLQGAAKVTSSTLAIESYTAFNDGADSIDGSTATLDVSSSTLQLKITGIAATTIDWWGTLEIEEAAA
jgi:hypothetical protein